jgi:hypothetical protein
MRNKTIRVAVVGAMLVSFAITVSPAEARNRRSAGSRNQGGASLLSHWGGYLLQWMEALSGVATADVSPATKTTPAPVAGSPVRTTDTSAASTDRSGAIDPWGLR